MTVPAQFRASPARRPHWPRPAPATTTWPGLNVSEVRRSRRRFAVTCIDWTQRRGHLNGALAAAITTRLFELGWIERGQRRRSVRVTEAGAEGLALTFGLDLA